MSPEQIAKAAPLVAKMELLEAELAEIQAITPVVTYKKDENTSYVVFLDDAFAAKVTSQVTDFLVGQINTLRGQLRLLGVLI